MSKLSQRLRKIHQDLHTDNGESKRSLLIGSIVATIIAATPFLFYLHESVPETEVWSTFLFTFKSNFYQNANQAMWMITGKAIPLLLLFLWFFTCRHWWYHALLVPIAMYAFQLASFFSYETQLFDQFQLIYLVPVMAIIIPSIYLIRAQMFNKINDADKTLEDLEEEFMIKPKNFLQKLGDYF